MQAMDVARGASSVEAVYVIGQTAEGLPPELNTGMRALNFEHRYNSTIWFVQTALNYVDNNEITFNFLPINVFERVRSYCVGMQFNVAPPVVGGTPADMSPQGGTSITPLPGIGVTYWDQFLVMRGTSQQALTPTIPQVHTSHMMRYQAFVEKHQLTGRKWWEMAGFYDVKTYDYCGGISGQVFANYCSYNENPGLGAAAADAYYLGNFNRGTATFQEMACDGLYGVSLMPGQTLAAPGNAGTIGQPVGAATPAANVGRAPVRQYECGLWLDEQMQRYRVNMCGMAGHSSPQFNCLVKLGLVCDFFESPLAIPGQQMNIVLRYTESNAARPRYINTPFVCTTGGNGVATDLQAQATYGGITPNQNRFYIYSENVIMRADIQGSYFFVWSSGRGLPDHMTYYDWFTAAGLVNIQSCTQTIVQSGNNLPFVTAFSFQLQPPFLNLGGANNVSPEAVTQCPYVFADIGVSQIQGQITTPAAQTFNYNFWQTGARPNSWSPLQQASAPVRGVIDQFDEWHRMGYDTQFLADTVLEDVDERCSGDKWKFINMPACGSLNLGAPGRMYGSHAVLTNGALQTINSGTHNQFWHFMWHPLGYKDVSIDYGTPVGSLRTDFNFLTNIQTTFRINALSAYTIGLSFLGSGQVATNLRVK